MGDAIVIAVALFAYFILCLVSVPVAMFLRKRMATRLAIGFAAPAVGIVLGFAVGTALEPTTGAQQLAILTGMVLPVIALAAFVVHQRMTAGVPRAAERMQNDNDKERR